MEVEIHITDRALALLAFEFGIDKRTLRRRIRGELVHGLAGVRADRAIAAFLARRAERRGSAAAKGTIVAMPGPKLFVVRKGGA